MILKSREGQSLMELLIGMAVGAIFIVGAAGLIIPSLQVNKQAGNVQVEGQIAQDMAANIRAWAASNWGAVQSLATGTTNGYILNTSVSPFTVTSVVSSTIVLTYTSSTTWTKPGNLISANIQVIGAGGAGGGNNNVAGGGGGSSAFGTYVIAPGGGGGNSDGDCFTLTGYGVAGGTSSGGRGGDGWGSGWNGSGGGGGAYAQATLSAASLGSTVSVYVGQGGSLSVGGTGYFSGGNGGPGGGTTSGGGGGGGATGAGNNYQSGGCGTYATGGTGGAVGTVVAAGSDGSRNGGGGGAAGGPIGGAGGSTSGAGKFPGGGGGGATAGTGGAGAAGEVIVTETLNNTSTPVGLPLTVCSGAAISSNTYSYNRSITINGSQVSSTLTNFPVLISGTYSYLANVAYGGNVQNANGYDIAFSSDAAGINMLPFEQESYSSSTGAVNYWVSVPSLSAGQNTVIYLWYGNTSITTSQANAAGVWSNGKYSGVWHLPNGTALSANDSTANANNGSLQGTAPTATAGIVDGAASFGGSGYVSVPANASLAVTSTVTVSAWVNFTTTARNDIYDRYTANPWHGYALAVNVNGAGYVDFWNGLNWLHYSAGINNGNWHYIVGQYDGTTSYLYVDGALKTSGALAASINSSNIVTFGTASDVPGTASNYTGKADEVRMTTGLLSSGWILTEYNNQNSPSAFYTIGSTNSRPASNCAVYNRYFYLMDAYRDAGGNVTSTPSGNLFDPSTKLVTIVISPASSTAVALTYPFYITRTGGNQLNQLTWLGGAVGTSSAVTFVSSTYGGANSVTVTASGTLQLSPASAPGGACYTNANSSRLADWLLNEGSGLLAYDTSGNAVNSTWNGAPAVTGSYYATGTVGSYAGFFNGTDDYVSVPSAMASSLGGTVTVSGWVYLTSCANWSRLVDFGNGTPNGNILLAASNGTTCRPQFTVENGGTDLGDALSSAFIPLNTWTLLTGVVNGTTSILYMNGSQVASVTLSAALTTATRNTAYIGKSDWSTDSLLNGLIDDVRIYSTALTPTDVASIYSGSPPSSGLVARYNFESNPNDSSGNGYTGTWSGTPSNGAIYYTTGNLYSYAGNFNGTNDYTTASAFPAIGSGSFTITAWIKTSTTGTRKQILSLGSGTANQGEWFYVNTSNKIESDLSGGTGPSSSSTVTDGNWHFVAVTNTAGTFQVYVDGVASGASSTGSPNIQTGAWIGTAITANQWFFNGALQDVRVYARALLSSEINALYTGGTVN